jgi:hypothetical protein
MNDRESSVEQEDSEDITQHKVWDTIAYYLTPLTWVLADPSEAPIEFEDATQVVYRVSLPDGISAQVSRDGLFAFTFQNSARGLALAADAPFEDAVAHEVMRRRLQILNAHLACLYIACIRNQDPIRTKMELHNSDLILSKSDDSSQLQIIDFRTLIMYLSQRAIAADKVQEIIPYLNRSERRRQTYITEQSVIDSFDLLRTILTHATLSALSFAEILIQSCAAVEQSNYDRSLILSWAVTEKPFRSIACKRH